MIYVTLGTQARDFSRFMKMLESLVKELKICDEIIAQTGFTTYKPDCITCFDFVPEGKYQEYMNTADIVITHAGTGAIFSALKKGKKVIAVARLKKYGEMVNDHQQEVVKKLSNEGYILDGTYSIIEAWKKIDGFTPRKFEFKCTLPQEIGKKIDSYLFK